MVIQICGLVAMLFSVVSFQMNTHKKIMRMQMSANLLFAIQYLAMGAYSGAAMHGIGLMRGIVFYNSDKKWAKGKVWIISFVLMFIVFGVITFDLPISILPPLAMVLNTFSFASTNPQFTRRTILISSPMWLVYSVVTGSIGGAINECFVMCSSILGIFRYRNKKVIEDRINIEIN